MNVKEKLALIKGDFAKRWAEAKVEIKGISDKSEKVAKMLDFLKQLFIAIDQKELLLASQFNADFTFDEYDGENLDGETLEYLSQIYKDCPNKHGWWAPNWFYPTSTNFITYAERGIKLFDVVRLALIDGKMMFSAQLMTTRDNIWLESDWMDARDIDKTTFWSKLIDILIKKQMPWLYDDKYAAMFPKPEPSKDSARIYNLANHPIPRW
jgi:hypothetical protein